MFDTVADTWTQSWSKPGVAESARGSTERVGREEGGQKSVLQPLPECTPLEPRTQRAARARFFHWFGEKIGIKSVRIAMTKWGLFCFWGWRGSQEGISWKRGQESVHNVCIVAFRIVIKTGSKFAQRWGMGQWKDPVALRKNGFYRVCVYHPVCVCLDHVEKNMFALTSQK